MPSDLDVISWFYVNVAKFFLWLHERFLRGTRNIETAQEEDLNL